MMKYRVYDRNTRQDITDKYKWVITPEGKLYYMEYCDFIGYPNAMIISETAAKELEAERARKQNARCHKCVHEVDCSKDMDNWGNCQRYKRDALDGGFYG